MLSDKPVFTSAFAEQDIKEARVHFAYAINVKNDVDAENYEELVRLALHRAIWEERNKRARADA